MPKTRLISPGSIPNHKLLKNLQLQDNYLSNDGGDEGIRIDNDGKVGVGDINPIGTLSVAGTLALTSEGITPTQPQDGKGYIYTKAGGGLYWRSYDLTELSLSGGAADGLTAVQPADTFYIGTTSIAHNRGSGALTLAGITLTTPDIGTPSAGTLTNCTFPTLNQSTTGTAAIATTVTLTDNESTDEANPLWFSAGAAGSGNIAPEADGDLYYNPSSGILGTKGLKLSYNGSNYADITVADDGEIEIANTASGSTGDITLDSAADIRLEAAQGDVFMYGASQATSSFFFQLAGNPTMTVNSSGDASDEFLLAVNANGQTDFITRESGGGSTAHLDIDIDGAIILDSHTGEFIAKKAGTEFSVANSSFAGMILGYATVGIDAAPDAYTLTTSFAVTDSGHNVSFIAPPSGVVEIFVSVYCDFNRRTVELGLSDNSSYNTIDVTHEHQVTLPPSSAGDRQINHRWVITGLTAGTSYRYYLGAKSSHALANVFRWGGDSTGEYAPFIMKATALPTAVGSYAVYG